MNCFQNVKYGVSCREGCSVNKKYAELDFPAWFDGKDVNEAAFCREFLSKNKLIYADNAFFTPDERFVEACHELDRTEYYLDILTSGDSHERTEVIQQQMADGKLDRLRQRLEKIHEEETNDGYDTADVA